MELIGMLIQGEDVMSSFSFIDYLLAILLIIVVGALSFYVSRWLTGRKYRREAKSERARMFDIEKALKDFWEHERGKLAKENEELKGKVELLEKQVEDYRKKAAGVGVMGLGKDQRTDMMVQLMLENEALEEKLYEQNIRMKEERDEYLEKQIKDISYKRIMLSEILKNEGVQNKIREVIKSDSELRKLELPENASSKGAKKESGETEEEEEE